MLEKNGILFVILFLLLAFYLVIRLGAGKRKEISKSHQMLNYLSGVRILIIIVASVSIILWSFI